MKRKISWLSISLLTALLAIVGGAMAAFAQPEDGAGGGEGGTATAIAGEGDTATAIPGTDGAPGTEVGLPLHILPGPDVEHLLMVRYVAEESESEESQDPNAYVDHSGGDGESVSVIGGGGTPVMVAGEHGADGATGQGSGTAG
jgi:hypothetical protein